MAPPTSDEPQANHVPMENEAYQVQLHHSINSTGALGGVQGRPVSGAAGGVRANSAINRPKVSNTYLRNQKLVQLRKKEQQFCYYLQQHR